MAAVLALVFPERQQGTNYYQKPRLTNFSPLEPVTSTACFKVHIFLK